MSSEPDDTANEAPGALDAPAPRHDLSGGGPNGPLSNGLLSVGTLATAGAGVLVAVGLALRLEGLGDYWLNPDEGIYFSTLTQPSFADFWAEVMANAHPPAFYLLLRGMGVLTWDFVLLRGMSLVFGVAAIWMLWLVGRELGGPGLRGVVSGLTAAALLAVTPNAVALSQILRPYMLLVFLLALGLHGLLRYGATSGERGLGLYVGALCLAVLTHYSALLALGVFSVLIAYQLLAGRLTGASARRLVAGHAIPFVLFAVLYVTHARAALESDLMADALGPGGWLTGWLSDTPEAAWRNVLAFQTFHAPVSFRVRTTLLLLAAIGLSAFSTDRRVAILAGSALLLAVTASALGLYPLGESRHNAWLVVFTMPALGRLAGTVVSWTVADPVAGGAPGTGRLDLRPRGPHLLAAAGGLSALLLLGGPLERALGGPRAMMPGVPTAATEARILLQEHLAPLVVSRLDPEGSPHTIVMTEQTYNVLMPLYAGARMARSFTPDSAFFRFDYGSRQIVVERSWDWAGVEHLGRVLGEIPRAIPGVDWEAEDEALVLAGGWGSELLGHVPELVDRGVVTDQIWALGPDPEGELIVRLSALTVEPTAMDESAATAEPAASPGPSG